MRKLLVTLLLLASAFGQTIQSNELRMKAKTRPAGISNYYRIVVNSATGQLSCVKPDGSECLAAAGGGGGTVGLSLPASVFNVTNSPITPPGTLNVLFVTQSANQVFAGPTTGSPATPAFRQLNVADIPSLDTSQLTSGLLPIARGGTAIGTMTDNAILVGNNLGGYTKTPLCTGVMSYDLTTRVFTCAGAGANATLGANTFSGTQTINLGTVPNIGIELITDPSGGTFFTPSNTIKFKGVSNDGTAHQPTFRIYNDVQTNAGYAEFALQYRLNEVDAYVPKLRVTSDGRLFPPSFTTAGACAAGAYWIGTDTTLNKMRKCENGALSDLDTTAAGSGSGTVTSVGMTVPSIFNVSGSPVTTSGTLGLTLATQTSNTFLSGPSGGAASAPTFRAIVPADVPTLNQNTSGTAAALGGNGTNCASGNAPLGVDAAGNAENCFDVATQTEFNTHTSDNAAHGATASNNVSSIVLRNASGNFSAGTITAALTGNATTATALAANGTNCSAGNYPLGVDASGNAENCTAAAGAGTVTSVSTGNLSPLFSAAIANATTTPALSFTLSTAAAHTFFGNNTGSTAAPAFSQINVADVAGTFPIAQGGTGQTTALTAFNALSPLTTLGDLHAHDGTNNVRIAGNTTTTRKFLRQTGNGTISAAPVWDTLLAADVPTLNQNTTGTAAALASNGTNCSAGNYPLGVDASGNAENCTAASGAGTVTNFSAGDLTPIFTTTEATTTTTPALSFVLSTAAAHTYLGNNTGSTAAPQYSALVAADIPTLNQNTTGTAAALTANGSNCAAGTYPLGVTAAGAGENCTDIYAETAALTNKTYDSEGTGNTLTTVSKVWLDAATCQNATASLMWDTPTTNPAVAACITGTNTQKGVADFADGANSLSIQDKIALPSDWTGAIDVKFKWLSATTSGNVVWQIATICVADAETDDPAFNTASTVTDTTKGTTNQTNDATITGITTTGCAAGELMHVKVFRDPAHASDTMAGTARLIGVELTFRRAE
jgi:hypothetical protein